MVSKFSSTRGFTLIELIVVMAVLVVLAGLLLPKMDVFKLKANKAQAASNMASVMNAVSSYRTQHDVYPDVWDSLLDSSAPTTLYPKLHPSLTGAPGGTATKMATTTIATADELNSLLRVGITSVVDHDAAASLPNNSTNGVAVRLLQVGDSLVTPNLADTTGKVANILLDYYPQDSGSIPAGKKVVVFGLGRFNEMVGDTIHAPPIYANADQLTQYSRMLVLFELADGGGRARMLGALAADGDRFEGEIQDFYKN